VVTELAWLGARLDRNANEGHGPRTSSQDSKISGVGDTHERRIDDHPAYRRDRERDGAMRAGRSSKVDLGPWRDALTYPRCKALNCAGVEPLNRRFDPPWNPRLTFPKFGSCQSFVQFVDPNRVWLWDWGSIMLSTASLQYCVSP
jgi:hypothetical protein